MIIISDTSPLIHLAACDKLDLLHQLYGQIVVPVSVNDEILLKCKDGQIRKRIIHSNWIVAKRASDANLVANLDIKLGGAEAEAIALAIELSADLLLIDEKKGRAIAKSLHIKTGGVISVLIEAKRQNLISLVVPVIEQMIQYTGFRISDELFREIKRITGE